MSKKTIITTCIVVGIILLIFFVQNVYKKINIGNTIINQSTEQMINNILNMKSYSAKITVKTISNKNENTYVIEQKSINEKSYEQEVIEPSSVKGVKIQYNGANLKIENTRLNLNKIYESYPYLVQNELLLNSFIQDYKIDESSTIEENENEIILNAKIENNNKYIKYKTLIIDKKTGKPTKLEIKDVTQNVLVYILYNDIEINSLEEKTTSSYLAKTNN